MISEKELDAIATVVAVLSRHEYWRKELWRTRETLNGKYKNYNTADVQNAFLTLRLKNFGIYSSPCGACWTHIWPEPKYTDEYLEPYRDLFADYVNWQWEQR